MQWRKPVGMKAATCQVRHRHRMEERARRGTADFSRRRVLQFRQDAYRIHVRELALARPHAHGGIALEQLDIVEALLRRISKILKLQVYIEINEVLSARMVENRIR